MVAALVDLGLIEDWTVGLVGVLCSVTVLLVRNILRESKDEK